MLYCTNEPMKLSMLVLTSFLTASIIHVSVLEAGGCSSSHYPLNIPPAQPVPSFDAQGNLMLENTTSTAPTSSTPPATQLPLCQTVDGASPLLRKEWRQLTAIEKNSFLDSIWALKRTETVNPEERHRRSNRYDDLVRSYAKGFKDYKGKPSFLPFIRRFLKRIELEMQEISGNISMT